MKTDLRQNVLRAKRVLKTLLNSIDVQVVQRILTAGQHSILGEYRKSAEKYFYVTYFIKLYSIHIYIYFYIIIINFQIKLQDCNVHQCNL